MYNKRRVFFNDFLPGKVRKILQHFHKHFFYITDYEELQFILDQTVKQLSTTLCLKMSSRSKTISMHCGQLNTISQLNIHCPIIGQLDIHCKIIRQLNIHCPTIGQLDMLCPIIRQLNMHSPIIGQLEIHCPTIGQLDTHCRTIGCTF